MFCHANLSFRLINEGGNICVFPNRTVTSRVDNPYPLGRELIVLLAAVSVFMLASVGVYEWKHRPRKETAGANRISLLATAACSVHCIISAGYMFAKIPGIVSCQAYVFVIGSSYISCMCLIYLMLWMRQRKFYSDPLLCNSIGKPVRVISSCLIAVIVILTISLTFAFVSSVCVFSVSGCCSYVWRINEVHAFLIPTTAMCFTVTALWQIAVFYLLARPLLEEDKSAWENFCNVLWRIDRDIHVMLRRLCICMLVCVGSSLFINVIAVFNAFGLTCWHTVDSAAFDVVISNFATICTFADWRKRLFSFTVQVQNERSSGGSTLGTRFRSSKVGTESVST